MRTLRPERRAGGCPGGSQAGRGRASPGEDEKPAPGGAGLPAPCFPLKRGQSGKKGKHVLDSPEQFTDWTEEAAEAPTDAQGSCFQRMPGLRRRAHTYGAGVQGL